MAKVALVAATRSAFTSFDGAMMASPSLLGRACVDAGASPIMARAVAEVVLGGSMRIAELAAALDLSNAAARRLVRRLVERYFVIERPDPRDARVKLPTLHEDGRILLDTVAETFLLIALAELAPEDRRVLLAGTAAARHPARVVLRVGPIAGALGRIVEMHARYYAGVAGFGSPFERAVAIELADFLGRVERPTNRLWLAVRGDRIVGSIAIDGEDLGPGTAHLRWFILEEGERGGGVGSRLLSAALAFCDEIGFGETRLWTFEGLRAARRLYEKSGFRLVEEKTGDRWGAPVVEQSFSRAMAPGRPLM